MRVRGWIEQPAQRPVIDLSAAGLIEVLDAATAVPRVRGRRRAARPAHEPAAQEPETKPPGLVETGR